MRVVAGDANGVAGDHEAARVAREDRRVGDVGHGRAGHLAFDLLERDAVAAAGDHFAISDADGPAAGEMHEATALRQRQAGAVEDEADEPDTVGPGGGNERGPLCQDEAGRPAHADDLPAARQPEVAGAVDARSEHERHARARRLVDCVLQCPALVLRNAGAYAEMQRIDPEDRERRRDRPLGRERIRDDGGGAGGEGEEMAAIEGHDWAHWFLRSPMFQGSGHGPVPCWDSADVVNGEAIGRHAPPQPAPPGSPRRRAPVRRA